MDEFKAEKELGSQVVNLEQLQNEKLQLQYDKQRLEKDLINRDVEVDALNYQVIDKERIKELSKNERQILKREMGGRSKRNRVGKREVRTAERNVG